MYYSSETEARKAAEQKGYLILSRGEGVLQVLDRLMNRRVLLFDTAERLA